ncbi:hypothetical protein R1flu_004625 [Riccia fluitans]|uniref:Uncharacterized protein n=1 Tax=Riccia fluitans TaxID=41844 RepID=A0ABD1YQU5_9MARC
MRGMRNEHLGGGIANFWRHLAAAEARKCNTRKKNQIHHDSGARYQPLKSITRTLSGLPCYAFPTGATSVDFHKAYSGFIDLTQRKCVSNHSRVA